MPQQLIYTSAPRGLVPGRSGYCTVARSAAMREALGLRLEQLSYYHHGSLGGAVERPIFAHRIVDIRGSRFHVLSRIQDAGLDFTGRTNFIAHHLVATPEECRNLPSPAVILRDWTEWRHGWNGEPELLNDEDWSGLAALRGVDSLPAQTWKQVTGEAINGFALLESAASIRVRGQSNEILLGLIAESLELLEVRDRRQDRRAAAWQFTFTTSLQEQDNLGDFRWRFIQADASARLTAGEGRAIETMAAGPCTEEEAALARLGRQPPRFIVEPQNAQVCDGETARLRGEAAGVPTPSYQWFSVDRQNNSQPVEGATGLELVLANPPRGVSRYVLTVKNSSGEATSRPAVLSVELRSSLCVSEPAGDKTNSSAELKPYQKSAAQIDENRQRLEARERELRGNKRRFFGSLLLVALALLVLGGAAVLVVLPRMRSKDFTSSASPTAPTPASVERPKPAVQESAPVPPRQAPLLAANDARAASRANSDRDAKERITMSRPGKVNVPIGWRAIGIGSVSRTNSDYLPDERPPGVTMSAEGGGFGEGGDNVLFVCTNSQKQFSAVLGSNNATSLYGGCGIMVRQTNATNSPFLFIGACSDKVVVYLRDTDGHFYSQSTDRPADPIRLTIKNDRGRYGPPRFSDGSHSYSFPENYSVDLKANSLVGFALASGSASNVATARFGFAMADQKSGGRTITE